MHFNILLFFKFIILKVKPKESILVRSFSYYYVAMDVI